MPSALGGCFAFLLSEASNSFRSQGDVLLITRGLHKFLPKFVSVTEPVAALTLCRDAF